MTVAWGATGWEPAAWAEVLERRADPDPFASPAWSRAWWEAFAPGDPAVLAVAGGGVVALHRTGDGTVHVMGGDDVTDYPGPVLEPGGADAMAEGLLARLGAPGAGWRALEVRNQRGEEGFAAALAAAARARGLPATLARDEPVARLALPATAAEWRAGLSRHTRHELARKHRRLARERPGATVRTATAATLDADLDAFVALHRAAPGAKGSFLTPARERFLRRIAGDAAAAGTLRLDTLEAGGAPLAMTFAFRTGTAFLLYNAGLAPEARALSPGIALVAALVERAIEERLAVFDFLRGLERYKLELGAAPAHLERVRVG